MAHDGGGDRPAGLVHRRQSGERRGPRRPLPAAARRGAGARRPAVPLHRERGCRRRAAARRARGRAWLPPAARRRRRRHVQRADQRAVRIRRAVARLPRRGSGRRHRQRLVARDGGPRRCGPAGGLHGTRSRAACRRRRRGRRTRPPLGIPQRRRRRSRRGSDRPHAAPRAACRRLPGRARAHACGLSAARFDVIVDGKPSQGRFLLVLASIGPRCGGGMRLTPGPSPTTAGWTCS